MGNKKRTNQVIPDAVPTPEISSIELGEQESYCWSPNDEATTR